MKTITINVVRGRGTDSFEEGKHPRANNGQFGAGEGKSHREHREHHAGRAEHHEAEASNSAGEIRSGHVAAAEAHSRAAIRHGVANREPWYAEKAHKASEEAHEASQKAANNAGSSIKKKVSEHAHRHYRDNIGETHTHRGEEHIVTGVSSGPGNDDYFLHLTKKKG